MRLGPDSTQMTAPPLYPGTPVRSSVGACYRRRSPFLITTTPGSRRDYIRGYGLLADVSEWCFISAGRAARHTPMAKEMDNARSRHFSIRRPRSLGADRTARPRTSHR